jgi:hypothetical protein
MLRTLRSAEFSLMRSVFTLLAVLSYAVLSAFSVSDVDYWIGSGENQAVVVIDWQDSKSPQSIAWGYRWNGQASGQDLMTAVVNADQRLSGNVDAIVSTLYYDLDNNGILDENDHNINYNNYPNSYWSYYVKESETENWSYSNNGISGRILQNGSWDAWVFVEDWTGNNPPPGEPVAAPNPANPTWNTIAFDDIQYWIGSGDNQAIFVVDFNDETPNPSFAWGYRWNGQLTGTQLLQNISAVDNRIVFDLSSSFLNDIILYDNNGVQIHSGIAGDPDWWSTWSLQTGSEWAMNGGLSSQITNGSAFGCSYRFTPNPTPPDMPAPMLPLNLNLAPVALDDTYYLRSNDTHILHVTKNDSDDQEFNSDYQIQILSQPEFGNLQLNDNLTISYISNQSGTFTDSFQYTIRDSFGLSSVSATVNLNLFDGFEGVINSDNSIAIPIDDQRIVNWANFCSVDRGYINIADSSLGRASYGEDHNACGTAEGSSFGVVSLGDAGTATLTFSAPVSNSDGFDFAVFENGISDNALELAFVEVSTDGNRFVRFPAVSLTQNETQLGNSDGIDPASINNLAGKYPQGFGTPFDLEDLADSTGININQINYIRIIDVVGSIDLDFASFDSNNNIVNDPYPTPFASSGFDLDAVAVIDNTVSNENEPLISGKDNLFNAYPNPFNPSTTLTFELKKDSFANLSVYNVKGQLVKTLHNVFTNKGKHSFNWNGTDDSGKRVCSGVYFYSLRTPDKCIVKKILMLK